MTTKTTLAALAAFFAAFAAAGETTLVSTGESAPFAVDSRPAPRIAAARETLTYSTAWSGGAAATVKAGDKTLATKGGEGTVVWNAAAEAPGLIALTHTAGGETLTADFAVLGEDTVAVDCDRLPTSATWASNRVYVVTQPLTVPSGVTLTIQPGAVVKFVAGASLTVASGGSCVARGVIFTHIADDTAGGDTLFDGDATRPVTGAYEVAGSVTDDDATEYRYTAPVVTSGTISSSTKWRGHKVYKVTGNLTVASGATLTIQPGAIVKFASGVSLTVSSGATLDAQGTRAAPIVFTSIKDDAWGGDTNGDGEKTYAQAGDWHQIRVSGTGKFKYAQILYNSSSENYGGLEVYGGQVDFDNSVIAHCKYECANFHSSGRMTARNSVFMDASLAFGYYGGSNAKAINCVFADLTTAIRQSSKVLKNSVFYRCVNFTDQGGDGSSFDHCVFYNPSGYGAQRYAKVGANGNIWADPLFTDPDNGDFTIAATSPCVDAGDGTVAPETDYYGRPRMDVKKIKDTGVANADGICPDIGIYEVDGAASVAAPDLAVVSLTASKTVRAGEEITVTYVVTNRAAGVVQGSVRDKFVFRGVDASTGGLEVEVGEIFGTYDLASFGVSEQTVRLTVPSLVTGAWKLGVELNAERDVYEAMMANNTGWATATSTATLATLEQGTSTLDVAAGASATYELTDLPSSGGVVRISGANADLAVYGGVGVVPGATANDAQGVRLADGSWLLVLPAHEAGIPCYLTLENGADAAVRVSVSVTEKRLTLEGVSPSRSANKGSATLTLVGVGLDETAKVTLGGRLATAVRAIDSARIAATFEMSGLSAGRHDAAVEVGGVRSSLAGAVEVYKATQGAKLVASLETPSSVRDGRVFTAYVVYANEGDEPMDLPLFKVASETAATKLGLSASEDLSEGAVFVGGIAPNNPAGVLMPGDSGKIPVFFRPFGSYKLTLTHLAEKDDPKSFAVFGGAAAYRAAMKAAATRLNLRGKTCYDVHEFVDQAEAEKNGVPCAAVSGVLRSSRTKEPLADVTIGLTTTNGVEATATTDSAGYFQLAGLADGIYSWRVEGGCSLADVSTNAVTIAGQADLNGREVYATTGGKISGLVVSENGGAIADASVVLSDKETLCEVSRTATDDSGVFEFAGLSDGEYTVSVLSTAGYCGTETNDVVISGENSSFDAELVLNAGARLEGYVTKDGSSVTNGSVRAAMDGKIEETTVDGSGKYRFEGLPAGEYDVTYYSDGYESDQVSVRLSVGETAACNLTATERAVFIATRTKGFGSLNTSLYFRARLEEFSSRVEEWKKPRAWESKIWVPYFLQVPQRSKP